MATQIEVGKEYNWNAERVIVKTEPMPLMEGMTTPEDGHYPGMAMQCEVMLIPSGRIDFAKVEELKPAKQLPHLIFTMRGDDAVEAMFDGEAVEQSSVGTLYEVLRAFYPPIAKTCAAVTFSKGENVTGMRIIPVTEGSSGEIPPTHYFDSDEAERFSQALYGPDQPPFPHNVILVNFRDT